MHDTQIAIVGAGAAGLSLAYRLAVDRPGGRVPSVVLLDAPAGPLKPGERTWCFWEEPNGEYDAALTAAWDTLRVHAPDGTAVAASPAPLRYKMLRSSSFESLVGDRLVGEPNVSRLTAVVEAIDDFGHGAEIRTRTAAGHPLTLRARWVFDSRPLPASPPARTTLLQHFRGWFVRTGRPAFDPRAAVLMDFRTPQPAHGLSFAYVLPTDPCQALVEYTEFSRRVLDHRAYEHALRRYLTHELALEHYEVTRAEHGVIPMTDARFPRRAGPSVFRIGTAGGATRPSTGYTFAAIQRQTRAIAAACHQGRTPRPPPAHSARSRAMDAVLLRALDTGRVSGASVFTHLFRHVPMERLLRFLDGRTNAYEDLTIGLHTPVGPMLRTAAELPWLSKCHAPTPSPEAVGRPTDRNET
ncbi:lycopene cyclase family protein [Streptomyces flavofungini]|uniref:Lycopene cyclase n=1 Tax=Streptomyces flavofungini TaxID=68200 RepID=A0ABS0XAY3_9ACTN|nr:lycopene cyclase family protein [Streptomyces flavofungini]MBJ3810365.1 lycopene cyclase [Streptomyces flavofungini]MBJ3811989.1 lycopene cyclase [Streptomyces flavofungini]GHC51224.1 lycopene cyclase [Streptomyces flavofungini]